MATITIATPEHLMTSEGSSGFGGEESTDPVIAAKEYAEAQQYYSLWPTYKEDNIFNLEWTH